MKVNLCDVCLAEGSMIKATRRIGYKGSTKLDICEAHKNYNSEEKNKMAWEQQAFKIRLGGEHYITYGTTKNFILTTEEN